MSTVKATTPRPQPPPPPPPPPPKETPAKATEAPKPKPTPTPTPTPAPKPTPSATTSTTPPAASTTTAPTATTAREARVRVQSDATNQLRQDQVRRTPTTSEVQSVIRTSRDAVGTSEATPDVKNTVREQLDRVGQRLQAGEVTPPVALAQANVWNRHLDESAQGVIREKIQRAEEIERMSPLDKAKEGAIGLGTGVLKTFQSVGQLAETLNDLNPVTAASDIVAGTVVRTVQTGDVGRSFDESVRKQVGETTAAANNTIRTGQAIGQIAQDLNNVNPALAATGMAADAVVGSVRTGDVGGSIQRAWNDGLKKAEDSGKRLLHLGGEISGINKIASGDPRLIGEGVFDLGMLAAPYAKSKPLTAVRPAAANNIVPFRRPPAAQVPVSPLPKTQPPAGVAVVDAPTAVRPRVVTVDPPVVQPSLSGSGRPPGPPRAAITTGQIGSGASGDRRLDELEENFRRQNGLDRQPATMDHDRRHALFGNSTTRRGEATINAAEKSFLDDAAKKDLSRDFFDPKNLQTQLDDFRVRVRQQLDHKREQVSSVLDKPADDLADTHELLSKRFREEGLRGLDDKSGARIEQRLDDLYYAHSTDPAAYRSAARDLIDEVLTAPTDRELVQRFKGNLTNLHAVRQKNPGFSTDRLLNDPSISRDIVRATPSEVLASRKELERFFAGLQ